MRRNVVAYLALFFALGGIAGAAAQPLLDRPGSVERSHIESGAVGLKKLAPNVRGEIDVPVPVDGLYTGGLPDGSMFLEARVIGGRITGLVVINGPCAWREPGGTYDSNGTAWTFANADSENQTMQALGKIVNERTLEVDRVLTGTGVAASQECDGPVTLTPQNTRR